MTQNWLSQFSATWDMLVDVPLPAPLRGKAADDGSQGFAEMALPLFPVVGAALGICAFLPSWLLLRTPGNPAAAIVAGILVPAMLEIMTRGRRLADFVSYFDARWRGASAAEALLKDSSPFDEIKSPSGTILLVSAYFFRAACVGALVAASCPFWLIVSLTGAYAVQAQMAGMPSAGGGSPVFEMPESHRNHHWYLGGAIMLVLGIACLPASAIALALAWLLSWHFTKVCAKSLAGVNAKALSVCGYVSECALLFLGVLLLP